MSHCAPEATLIPTCLEFTPKTGIGNVFVMQVFWEAVLNTWPGSAAAKLLSPNVLCACKL